MAPVGRFENTVLCCIHRPWDDLEQCERELNLMGPLSRSLYWERSGATGAEAERCRFLQFADGVALRPGPEFFKRHREFHGL